MKKQTQKQESTHKEEITKELKSMLEGRDISASTFNKIELFEFSKNSVLITVVVLPTPVYNQLKRSGVPVAVEHLENLVGGSVFLVRKQKPSGLKKGESSYRTGPTQKDYQEAVARDLVSPAQIVDRRTVVREDGSKLEKILIDSKKKKEVAHRLEPMAMVFEEMFGKKAIFQSNYY
ncbi:small subunit ribosomal protein S7e [Nematocida sp. LUAm3]|nr:small subunit ribosomal protein S7e [Nematocida sp. LUAm3]KAI5173561.1 small subunit ribosomal protein S7e [Nematocida sp. LUAm2]KAI5176782.1 small subunit ribosomal protein S7e [Nematocida sp. LUAm1]